MKDIYIYIYRKNNIAKVARDVAKLLCSCRCNIDAAARHVSTRKILLQKQRCKRDEEEGDEDR